MKKMSIVAMTALLAFGAANHAAAQSSTATTQSAPYNPYSPYDPYDPYRGNQDPDRVSTTFEVAHESQIANAYAGLAVGAALPGFIAFQANFASFGGIAPGMYLDLRLTGTTAGTAFGDGSPMWRDSVELDLRVGYGNRTLDSYPGTIRDGDKRKISARVPGAFGVTPYLGWRGRWGYNTNQIRLGLHVQRETNVEVRFTDGRAGSAFRHWAFDFELLYATGWQKGLGAHLGYDHWFNDFVYFRTELGFARADKKEFAPERVNPYTGLSSVSPAEGFWTKALIGFAFRFRLPDVTDSNARKDLGQASPAVGVREHSREVTPAADQSSTRTEPATVTPRTPPRTTTGCQSAADCDDGIFCNGEESCMGGICQPGTLPDDGISCTQLVCDENAKAFRFEPLHGLCGDGIFCNGTELCDPQAGCVSGTPIPVDDGNPCTRNYCDESMRRVVTEPIPGCAETPDTP